MMLDVRHVNSLAEALDQLVAPEKLCDDNRWQCAGCESLVDARKGLKITELPYILWLHLDRFQYDWQAGATVKLNHVVEFPHIIDLGGYVDDGSTSGSGVSQPACHTYELYSVLVHLGSAASGHHFNYTKSFEKEKWYAFSDMTVTEVVEDQGSSMHLANSSAMRKYGDSSAFMLCYRRVDKDRNISTVRPEEVPEQLKNIQPEGPGRVS